MGVTERKEENFRKIRKLLKYCHENGVFDKACGNSWEKTPVFMEHLSDADSAIDELIREHFAGKLL